MRRPGIPTTLLGAAITLLLTGCTPGAIGFTFMLDEAGDVRGVVHICRSDVNSFSAAGIHVDHRDGWAFDSAVAAGDTMTVRIGSREDVFAPFPRVKPLSSTSEPSAAPAPPTH